MIKFSTKARYGTRLMIDVAVHEKEGPVSVGDIARRQEISAKYLERLVPLLKKAKLVHSLRGLNGGLVLNRAAGEINLKDIVEALEGPICVVQCVRSPSICKRNKNCPSIGLWESMTKVIAQALAAVSLKKMAKGTDFPQKLVIQL